MCTNAVLGWDNLPPLELGAIRMLVALGWVAAGFLYALRVTPESPEVHPLAQLGGWTPRQDRPPGQRLLTSGL